MKCRIKAQRLYFNRADYLVFELYILKRPGAEKDFSADELAKAKKTK
jgi:mannonate dehydratase